MKAKVNNTRDFELIGMYLAGEMSEVDAVAFTAELNEDKNRKQLFEQMQNDWKNMEMYKEEQKVNTDKAWNKLFERLDGDELVSRDTRQQTSPKLGLLVRWAAVAVVFITAGIVFFSDLDSSNNLIVVQTSTESTTLVQTLADGSIVYISSNSELSFPKQFKGNKRNVKLKGEAFFDISRNPDQPFVIETDEMIVEVLGTSFNLKTLGKGHFELMVETGLVKVSKKDAAETSNLVNAGEFITFVNNSMVVAPSYDKTYLGWRKNRMQFKDERLSDIIQVINRNYKANIEIQSQELGERRMTVTFHDNTLETITELICKTLVIKAEKKDSTILLLNN